jgi:hypothetical protein
MGCSGSCQIIPYKRAVNILPLSNIRRRGGQLQDIVVMATTTITTTTPNSSGSGSFAPNKKVVRIRVTKETADHLRLLARDREEGWNDIIRRLISFYEEDKNSILREAKRFYLTDD